MKSASLVSILVVLIFVSSSSSSSASMAEEFEMSSDGRAVHIVNVDRPDGEDAEAFHIRILASVVGGEEAAKEALIYHYKHAASGFSAKLTPKQVSDLSEKPEVLQVTASRIVQLHGARAAGVRPGVI